MSSQESQRTIYPSLLKLHNMTLMSRCGFASVKQQTTHVLVNRFVALEWRIECKLMRRLVLGFLWEHWSAGLA